ncbi:MAG: hypothetical protein AAGN15_25130 [Cyanobacteria bacterium J06581_3]
MAKVDYVIVESVVANRVCDDKTIDDLRSLKARRYRTRSQPTTFRDDSL